MRPIRFASVAVAALALVAVSACKDTTTSGLGTTTCAAADAFLCPSSTLDLGFSGTGPSIVPGTSGTSVTSGTSAYTVTGTTSSTLPATGCWSRTAR